MMQTVLFYAESLAGGFFLWFGLYIITRGVISPSQKKNWLWNYALSAGLGLAFASGYFFGAALESTAASKESYLLWDRLTWWVVPISVAFWFRGIALLPDQGKDGSQDSRLVLHVISLVILIYGLFLALMGSFSNFLYQYHQTYLYPGTTNSYVVPPAFPQYYLYGFFLILTLWGAVFALIRPYQNTQPGSSLRYQLRVLMSGSLILALGATINVVGYDNLQGAVSQQIGSLIMTAGLGLIGFGVVNYNALMQQQLLKYDFRRSFWGTAILVFSYLLVFHLVHLISPMPLSPVTTPLLVFLITFTSVLRPWVRKLLNQWILTHWEANFVLQVAEIQQGIRTAPDQGMALALAQTALAQATQEAQTTHLRQLIEAEIETIFWHKAFKKDDILANSPLFNLALVQQSLNEFARQHNLSPAFLSEGERARVLRYFFEQYIHRQFSPYLDGSRPVLPADRWIEYMILSRSYLEDKTRKEVIAEIWKEGGIHLGGVNSTGGRLYAQHLENGRRSLATMLWQDEMRCHSKPK